MAVVRQQAPARSRGEWMISNRLCNAVCLVIQVTFLATSAYVEGLPILGPDLNTCKPVWPLERPVAEPLHCCFVDTSKTIKGFEFKLDLPMRVRRPAHKLDDEFIRKYERAVELMKALPPEDPRSFEAQSQLHCSYCAGAYRQFNSSDDLEVHMSWLLMPFHRWFLYFHERILASLISDDTFAIPYWAWDVQNETNPPANTIPSIYTNKNSTLHNEKRSKYHQPPYRADLQYARYPPGNKDPDVLMRDNYYHMWRAMVGHVRTPEAFYGGKVTLGDGRQWAHGGEFESGPHNSIHIWTGDCENFYGEDMGPPYSSGRDPIFYAHHSQVDRLWFMWKSWGGKDLDDADWLDSEFLFYDENADLVRVSVRDTLNFSNFRVTYEQLESDWVKYRPKSIREIDSKYAQVSILKRAWRQVVTGGIYANIPITLERFFTKEPNGVKAILGGLRREAVTLRVSRPEVLRSTEDSSVYDELLVISGVVQMPAQVNVFINMFMELPEADENTPQHCVEFLGGVNVHTEGLGAGRDSTVARKFIKTIGIRHTLQILGIIRQKSVIITFVPAWDPKHDRNVSVRVTDLIVEMKQAR